MFAAATITYNLIEAVAALWAGGVADSSALIGFGLDSLIEVASAVALSWQFSAKDHERREHLTLRIIAVYSTARPAPEHQLGPFMTRASNANGHLRP